MCAIHIKNNSRVPVNSDFNFFFSLLTFRIWFCKDEEHFLDAQCPNYFEESDTVPWEIKTLHHVESLYLNCSVPQMCKILKCLLKLSLTLHYCFQLPDSKVRCLILADWPGFIYNWWRQTLLRGDSSGLQRLWITSFLFLAPGYLLAPRLALWHLSVALMCLVVAAAFIK